MPARDRWELEAHDDAAATHLRVELERDGPTMSVTLIVDSPEGRAIVVDDSVAAPPVGLELRAPGLWLDLSVADPLVQVTLGVEAFAVIVDDPTEVSADARGERVALGVDLDWITVAREPPLERGALECDVVGEVVVGDRRMAFDGSGWRSATNNDNAEEP